ncbi:NAD-dependent epimerase/dehydratase family protein [Kribbella sp. GL6]|uniref:NAD-dependent epimerase/dehydratase family protein n=1 Tax=Kribbella sp. GL6 TaxID=3419765 RepID=UPI003D01F2C5
MRIFVAGGSGVIGRHLVPLLVAQGHEVTTLSRRASSSSVTGDVFDRDRLHELVAAARPDVVMHQLTDLGTRDFAANSRIRREGTRNLVDAALTAGVRRVISQSIAWAYEPGSTPADESTPLDVRSPDESRRTTVEAVATLESITAEAPEWVVLRYGMLYGPGTWYTKGGLMATAQLPTGPDLTSFLHIEDAAEAAASALTWPSGPVNIVDDNPLPASAWAPAFAQSVATPPATPPAPAPREPARTTPTPTEGTRTEGTRTEGTRTEGTRTEGARTEGTRTEGARTEGTRTEGARTAEARTGWARGATNARARALGWAPSHPTFLGALP